MVRIRYTRQRTVTSSVQHGTCAIPQPPSSYKVSISLLETEKLESVNVHTGEGDMCVSLVSESTLLELVVAIYCEIKICNSALCMLHNSTHSVQKDQTVHFLQFLNSHVSFDCLQYAKTEGEGRPILSHE